MIKRRVIFYLLGAFFAGNVLLIFIQYTTAQKTNSLIAGNLKLLNEIKVTSDLKELEIDINRVDNNSQENYAAKRAPHVGELQSQINEVKSDLLALQKISDDDSTVKYVDVLDTLVHRKLAFSNIPATNGNAADLNAGTDTNVNRKVKTLTDSIVTVIHKIDSSRQVLWQNVTLANDRSGQQAQLLGNILIGLVLLIGAVLFWYIINIIRRQNQLITQLHISEQNERASAKIKENFLANMSHEIRTPLNAIIGFTGLLRRKNLDSQSSAYVETIEKSGENLLTIVNDILDLSRIEAGMIRITKAAFNIREVLHAVDALFKEKATEKKLTISFNTDDAVPQIMEGDADRLTQVLINLVGNALKFTTQGSIRVSVTNEGVTGNAVLTGIAVTDTGIGIEKKKLQTIFERFRQAEDAVTRQYGGTGLGLSIVNELVLLQNGSIKVESEPGVGSTFKVMIPYHLTTQYTPAKNTGNANEPVAAVVNDFWILVAEDNSINQELISHLFREWQLKADIVNNGAEVIKALEKKVYQLILMDIQMPLMDGYTAAANIRNKLYLDVPIIAMTAHAMAGEKEKCLSYGMNDYIAKPIREKELYKMISRFVKLDALAFEAVPDPADNGYNCIDLTYMRQVSLGNKDYEKTVTGQFIEAVPDELFAIEKAWVENDLPHFRQLAHNFKTTVSVMGLNEKLEPILDVFEYGKLSAESFRQKFTELKMITDAAMQEAQEFYATL